jgi:hypothetical protein
MSFRYPIAIELLVNKMTKFYFLVFGIKKILCEIQTWKIDVYRYADSSLIVGPPASNSASVIPDEVANFFNQRKKRLNNSLVRAKRKQQKVFGRRSFTDN